MPRKVDDARWVKLYGGDTPESRRTCLRSRMSYSAAAEKAGVAKTTVWRLENIPNQKSSGRPYFERWRAEQPATLGGAYRLNIQAKKALGDFELWRLRYMGRKSTPWQVHAVQQVLAAMERAKKTLDPQFMVINVAPGSGKSELFGHDLPAWLICRDRSITIFIGSAGVDRAEDLTRELLTTFEAQSAREPNNKQRLRGAVLPEAYVVGDYGKFKPDHGRTWNQRAFTVCQEDGGAAVGKEATAAAVGRDTNYLGLRPDVVIWDDLVNEETSGTAEAREKTKRKYQREAEPRVELGGVMILQGQRQFPEDLYHDCVNVSAGDDDDPDRRKYLHIVYKAHYEQWCKGDHGKDAKPYNPFDPESGGCLLDPKGVSWRRLTEVRAADRADGTQNYRVVYQQEDGDPTLALVNPLWIDGGEDPKTRERFLGCWDDTRAAGAVPVLDGDAVSILSVDSSPSKFWACGWWLYHPDTERRILVDLCRSRMRVTDALAYDKDTKEWSGLFEDWWQSSQRQGRPITWLIFEAVAAEKFFLDSNDLQDWARARGVLVIKHDTHRNKTNPQYGVQMVANPYRLGRVRLPGESSSGSKAKVMPLVREATRYPDCQTEDCLMQQWFVEHNLETVKPRRRALPAQPRPAVVRNLAHRRLALATSRRAS